MPDLLTLVSNIVRLIRVGTRTFMSTLLLVMLAGIFLGMASSFALQEQPTLYRVLAVLLVVAETGVFAFYLAGRRSVSLTLAEGLTSMKLGSSAVGLVFDRLPASPPRPDVASLSPGLQRLGPGEAEKLLSNATGAVQRESGPFAGIKQKIQSQLLELVQTYALARVQKTPGQETVDLQSLRKELEETIDDRLADNLRDKARFHTFFVAILFPVIVAAQTYLLMTLAQSAPP